MPELSTSMSPIQVNKRLDSILDGKAEAHGTYSNGTIGIKVDPKSRERLITLVEHYGITDDVRTFRVGTDGKVTHAVREKIERPPQGASTTEAMGDIPSQNILFKALNSFKSH